MTAETHNVIKTKKHSPQPSSITEGLSFSPYYQEAIIRLTDEEQKILGNWRYIMISILMSSEQAPSYNELMQKSILLFPQITQILMKLNLNIGDE